MRIKDSSPCAFCDCVFLALAKQGEFIPKGNLSPRGVHPPVSASMLLLALFRQDRWHCLPLRRCGRSCRHYYRL